MTPTYQHRLWVLLGHDPSTGLATIPVGVAGTDGHDHAVSWLPLTHTARAPWTGRLATTETAQDMATALADTNGVTYAALELDDPPAGVDLRGAVEAAVDELLAAGAPDG